MKKKLNLKLSTFIKEKQLDLLIKKLQIIAQPLVVRWKLFKPREQQLIILLCATFALYIVVSIVVSAVNFTQKLNNEYLTLKTYQLEAQSIQKEFKDISKATTNEFSILNLARIEGDVTQALDVKNPDISLQDTTLTIKSDNVLFNSVILLLEQLRKSYGIFPNKLRITQVRSGYVNFNATFLVRQ